MVRPGQSQILNFNISPYAAAAVLAIGFVLAVLATSAAQAQAFTVIHSFTGGLDGGIPYAGLTIDAAGNLYGTTCGAPCGAGVNNAGTVFRLSNKASGWLFTTLYIFREGSDGAGPTAGVTIGPDGNLYGTTDLGGGDGCAGDGCGTVFSLKAAVPVPPNILGGWTESVVYSFKGNGDGDGAYPFLGDVTFDQDGNLYGTTLQGSYHDRGTVFQLTPSPGGWKEKVLYAFTGESDGAYPYSGVVFDGAGDLYGTTFSGGGYSCSYGLTCGTVFELMPSGSGWIEETVHSFQGGGDGGNPIGGVTPGLYGTTSWGGTGGGGTAFGLYNQFFRYGFTGSGDDYPGPRASLVLDATGSVYGTTYSDGAYQYGSVFELQGGAGWGYTSLHDFTGSLDGANPISSLVFDARGNIFGTTSAGGAYGHGVVFEITP